MSDQIRIEAVRFHGKRLPTQVAGEHLWVMLSMFRVTPQAGQYFLDGENLLSIEGPGCFWCEQPWTPASAARPCAGHA